VETAGKRDHGSCTELGAATEHPAFGAELTQNATDEQALR